MATFYLDFEGGDDSKDGTTFANRWKTFGSGATAARIAPGDTIRIMKSPDPVSLGVNGTFTKQSATVTLASAVTANISLCQAAWTASTFVVTNTSTTCKEGSLATTIAPSATFSTGKLAYEATGTLDLSAYTNVSFWIRANVTIAANNLRLDLCSDTAGATPVHSFTLDTPIGGTLKAFTFRTGSALNSAIKSVALTALVDFGAATITLDNIIACNNLHFNSLISTSSSATDLVCYPIRSINGTTVIVDNAQSSTATSGSRGWHDTTVTTTAYARDTVRITTQQSVNDSGTAAAPIIFSGGWDRTNMSTQDGQTIISSDVNSMTNAITGNQSSVAYEKISMLWGTNFWGSYPSSPAYIKNIGYYGTNNSYALSDFYCENLYYISNVATLPHTGVLFNTYIYSNNVNAYTPGQWTKMVNGYILNNGGHGLNINAASEFYNITSSDNFSYGVNLVAPYTAKINNITTANNNGAIGVYNTGGVLYLNNLTSTDSTKIGIPANKFLGYTYASNVPSYKLAIYNYGGIRINDVSTPVHGSATLSYMHYPDLYNTSNIPIVQPLQPFAVGASTLVTFSIWTRRTATDVVGRIRVRGNITPGVTNDITTTATAAINTWEQLTVTFTPSAAGVAQIELESYNATGAVNGTVYFGDATVSQA